MLVGFSVFVPFCLDRFSHCSVENILKMYPLSICFTLPVISALVTVQIHRNSVYQPVSSCAFIRNISWTNDVSIQSCIWQCIGEHDCQTAVYFETEKFCSTFREFCGTESIQSSKNVWASVICCRKSIGNEPFQNMIQTIDLFQNLS
jgi:hypothetical protein